MAAELAQLFAAVQSPDIQNEQRNIFTNQILEAFHDPNVINLIFEICMNSSFPSSARDFACLKLGLVLFNNWDSYKTNIAPLSNQILQVLSSLTDLKQKKFIVRSCKIILRNNNRSWPELMQYSQALFTRGQISDIELSLNILNLFVSYKSDCTNPDVIIPSMPFIQSLLESSFQSTSLISLGTQLLSRLLVSSSSSEFSISLRPYFIQSLHLFTNSFSQPNRKITSEISISLENAVSSEYLPLPPDQILNSLLEIAQHPEYSQSFHYLFNIIGSLFHSWCETLLDFIPIVIKACIECGALVYQGTNFQNEEDSWFVTSPLNDIAQSLCSSSNQDSFIDTLFSSLNLSDLPHAAVSFMCLYNVIEEENSSQILSKIKPINQLLIQAISLNVPQVKEIVIYTISDLAALLNPEQTDMGNLFIDYLFQIHDTSYPPDIDPDGTIQQHIQNYVLSALINIFQAVSLDVKKIPSILQYIIPLLSQSHFAANAIEALSDLCFAAEEDISPFTGSIFPIFMSSASQSAPEYQLMRLPAISGLANLLRFTPDALGPENCLAALGQIFGAIDTDPSDIVLRSAVVNALGALIVGRSHLLKSIPDIQSRIESFVDPIFETSIVNFTQKEANTDHILQFEELLPDTNVLISIGNALRLYKAIFKYMPELSPKGSKWIMVAGYLSIFPAQDIAEASISAFSYAYTYMSKTGEITPDMIPDIQNIFSQIIGVQTETQYPSIAAKIFSCFQHIIEKEAPIAQELMHAELTAAFGVLDGKLACQRNRDEEEEEIDLQSKVLLTKMIGFLKSFISHHLDEFDVGAFLKKKDKLFKSGDPIIIGSYISTMAMLYKAVNKSQLTKGQIFKICVDALNFCDGNCEPEPIRALQKIAALEDITKLKKKRQFGELVEKVQKILENEFEGEPFFFETQIEAMTLLILLGCNLEEYIQKFLSLIPLKTLFERGNVIYSTITPFLLQHFDELGEIFQMIALAVIGTLGMKESNFNRMELSAETINNLKILMKMIGTKMNMNEMIPQILTDPTSQERLKARMQ